MAWHACMYVGYLFQYLSEPSLFITGSHTYIHRADAADGDKQRPQ